jgi:hypothetical protein
MAVIYICEDEISINDEATKFASELVDPIPVRSDLPPYFLPNVIEKVSIS